MDAAGPPGGAGAAPGGPAVDGAYVQVFLLKCAALLKPYAQAVLPLRAAGPCAGAISRWGGGLASLPQLPRVPLGSAGLWQASWGMARRRTLRPCHDAGRPTNGRQHPERERSPENVAPARARRYTCLQPECFGTVAPRPGGDPLECSLCGHVRPEAEFLAELDAMAS